MNNPPAIPQHMSSAYPPRRQGDYRHHHQQQQQHQQQQHQFNYTQPHHHSQHHHAYAYPAYPHPSAAAAAAAYYGHPQAFIPQWYQPHQPYPPPMPHAMPPRSFQPPPGSQSPLIVSSHSHARQQHPHQQPGPTPSMTPTANTSRAPYNGPQPAQTPQPEQSTPSTGSQPVVSPSTTPTTASISTPTPPVTQPKDLSSISTASDIAPPRSPFRPPLPWTSVPASEFPVKPPRRRRKRRAPQLTADAPQFPARSPIASIQADSSGSVEIQEHQLLASPDHTTQNSVSSPNAIEQPSEHDGPLETRSESSNAATRPQPSPSQETISGPHDSKTSSHHRAPTKSVVPVVPVLPHRPGKPVASPTSKTAQDGSEQISQAQANGAVQDIVPDSKPEDLVQEPIAPASKQAPKSWAELLRSSKPQTNGTPGLPGSTAVSDANGVATFRTTSLAEALRSYEVDNDSKISFLEPRGLVNTGNMCYMNSILQVLVFCVPFFEFLDQVAKRAAHSFKSDTPLIEAMILFMREFNIIDSAKSIDQLRLRLKDGELEQYGEPFIPEYVYEVIRRLPRFSSMRRGHQQDAEEFLGFLLEGLHDECVHIMTRPESMDAAASQASSSDIGDLHGSSRSERANGGGWLEVGPKQKPSVTRSSGSVIMESPITKIFGGKLRSEFRVPGLKNSVTLEPYQPLQLDIGDSTVVNITDALKRLTRPETIHGDFNSPRGPGTVSTKQVFIETVPPVLILHLKRFQYDNAGGTQKIWKRVGYPLELEIPKEVFPPSKRGQYTARPQGLPRYQLISVVYHHGKNASGGHYTVDVRRQEGREWIRLDDTLIRRVRSELVANEGAEDDPKMLAAALERHKREASSSRNMYADIIDGEGYGPSQNEEEEDDSTSDGQRGGWSQVNGNTTSPPAANSSTASAGYGGKKWSGVVATGPTAGDNASSASGKRTPNAREGKSSVKDNRVAYILLYKQIS